MSQYRTQIDPLIAESDYGFENSAQATLGDTTAGYTSNRAQNPPNYPRNHGSYDNFPNTSTGNQANLNRHRGNDFAGCATPEHNRHGQSYNPSSRDQSGYGDFSSKATPQTEHGFRNSNLKLPPLRSLDAYPQPASVYSHAASSYSTHPAYQSNYGGNESHSQSGGQTGYSKGNNYGHSTDLVSSSIHYGVLHQGTYPTNNPLPHINQEYIPNYNTTPSFGRTDYNSTHYEQESPEDDPFKVTAVQQDAARQLLALSRSSGDYHATPCHSMNPQAKTFEPLKEHAAPAYEQQQSLPAATSTGYETAAYQDRRVATMKPTSPRPTSSAYDKSYAMAPPARQSILSSSESTFVNTSPITAAKYKHSCFCGRPDNKLMVDCASDRHDYYAERPTRAHFFCLYLSENDNYWICEDCDKADRQYWLERDNQVNYDTNDQFGLQDNQLGLGLASSGYRSTDNVPSSPPLTRDDYTHPHHNNVNAPAERELLPRAYGPALIAPPKPKGRGTWSSAEENACIELMQQIKVLHYTGTIDELWQEVSRGMKARGMERTAAAVKNQWNRHLRAKSGFDERAKPKPHKLVTGILRSKADALLPAVGKSKPSGRKRTRVDAEDHDDEAEDDVDTHPNDSEARQGSNTQHASRSGLGRGAKRQRRTLPDGNQK